MGYPKNTEEDVKLAQKKKSSKKKQEKINRLRMEFITQIRKLSLWIFIIPL